MVVFNQKRTTVYNFNHIKAISVKKSESYYESEVYDLTLLMEGLDCGYLGSYSTRDKAVSELEKLMSSYEKGEKVYWIE